VLAKPKQARVIAFIQKGGALSKKRRGIKGESTRQKRPARTSRGAAIDSRMAFTLDRIHFLYWKNRCAVKKAAGFAIESLANTRDSRSG
jgi:hypothetical protein